MTGVGARDTCESKNKIIQECVSLHFCQSGHRYKEWKIDTIYLTEDPLFYCTLDAFLWNWEGYTISFIFQLAQVL